MIIGNRQILDEFNTKFDNMMAMCLKYDKDTPRSKEIGQKLRDAYITFDKIDKRSFEGLGQVMIFLFKIDLMERNFFLNHIGLNRIFLKFTNNFTAYRRRNDRFWCKQIRSLGEQLYRHLLLQIHIQRSL